MRKTEADEQKELAVWLNNANVLWCHVPNGEKRDARTGAKLRAMGVRRGVPDVLIFTPPPGSAHVGFAIELKAVHDKKGPTDEQRQWLQDLSGVGWHTRTARGAAEAIRILKMWGYRSSIDDE